MIIATKELINQKKDFKYNIIADINNLKKLKEDLSKIKKDTSIKIYDIGVVKKESKKTIEVKDHINKTGINPIIGNDKIEFKDIGRLYKSKKGTVTTCCGKSLNLN